MELLPKPTLAGIWPAQRHSGRKEPARLEPLTAAILSLMRAAVRRRRERQALACLSTLSNHLRKDIGLAPLSEPDRHRFETRYLGWR